MAELERMEHIPVEKVSRLQAALDEMAAAIGADHVHADGVELERVARATIPNPKRPAALVTPKDSAQVAQLVRIANHYNVALWPVSQGRNWGYGSATACHDDAVVLHLGRLNQIVEVNEELAYAVIEPGVTYRQLRQFLETHHPNLWCDCTDGPPDGSVIGNALDRGLGVTHYADHFGTLCGLEVVLPTGRGDSNRRWSTELPDLAHAQMGSWALYRRALQSVEPGYCHPSRCVADAEAGSLCIIYF